MVSGQRIFMERPFLAQSDADYFRYCVVFLADRLSDRALAQALACRAGLGHDPPQRSVRAWRRASTSSRYKVWAFTLAGFLAGVAGRVALRAGRPDGSGGVSGERIGAAVRPDRHRRRRHWAGPIVAGLLLRAFPSLLNDFGINGNIATMIFGAGLLHALITAPQGVSGQLIDLSRLIRAKAARLWVRKSA